VSEETLTGVEWGGPTKAYVELEDRFLPALVRGWADSRSDCQGHVYYAMTAAGWATIDRTPAAPTPPAVDPDDDAFDLYLHRVKLALGRLDTVAPPDAREIGPMPLPVCGADGPIVD
jgi:hypothetical protein